MLEIRKSLATAVLVCLSWAGASAQSVGNRETQTKSGPPQGANLSQQTLPQFEVASIRPAASREPVAGERVGGVANFCGSPRITMDQSIVRYTCVSLRFLVAYAFGMPITEPDWMKDSSSLKFDIVARIPKDATNAQVPEMFQALLRDRFKLSAHRGTQDETVLALLADSSGLKLKPASPQTSAPLLDLSVPCLAQVEGCVHRITNSGGEQTIEIAVSPGVRSYTSSNIGTALRKDPPGGVGRIRMEAPNTTLAGLASLASMLPTDQPKIVDMTGVAGRYDVVLEIPVDVRGSNNRLGPLSQAAEAAGRTGTPEGDAWRAAMTEEMARTAATAQRALETELRKFGLRLEPRKSPTAALVIDHLEKSPTEN